MEPDAGQKFLTARGKAWAKSPMLALKSDRQRLGPFCPEAMTQIPFQKLVTLAYNLHWGRAQTFAITGTGSISISLFSLPYQGHQDRDICTASHHRTESPRCLPALCEL